MWRELKSTNEHLNLVGLSKNNNQIFTVHKL